jgi:hypothetical protein
VGLSLRMRSVIFKFNEIARLPLHWISRLGLESQKIVISSLHLRKTY